MQIHGHARESVPLKKNIHNSEFAVNTDDSWINFKSYWTSTSKICFLNLRAVIKVYRRIAIISRRRVVWWADFGGPVFKKFLSYASITLRGLRHVNSKSSKTFWYMSDGFNLFIFGCKHWKIPLIFSFRNPEGSKFRSLRISKGKMSPQKHISNWYRFQCQLLRHFLKTPK